jgi:hypothetical protein
MNKPRGVAALAVPMISMGMMGATAKHAPHLCGVPLGSMAPRTPPKKPMPEPTVRAPVKPPDFKEPMGNAPVKPPNLKEPMGNAPVKPPDFKEPMGIAPVTPTDFKEPMGYVSGTPTKIMHPTSGSSGSGTVRVMQVTGSGSVRVLQVPVQPVAGPVMQKPVPMPMPIVSPMPVPPATLRVPRIIQAPPREQCHIAKAKAFVIPQIFAAPKAILRTPIPFHKLYYVKHRSPPGSDDYSEL